MELEHFSHNHTLIFNEDLQQNESRNLSCFGCNEPISGATYSCKHCNFFLHKACAELPRQIKHIFHRKHPLLLQENPTHNDLLCLCRSCGIICGSFVYRCSLCDFNLDIKCANLPPCILEPTENQHQLISLVESRIPYYCDCCGGYGPLDSYAYLCTICQVVLHSDCRSMLRHHATIETTKHNHWLIYTFFLHENESGKQSSGICNDEIITDHGCYFCSECNYVSHRDCAFRFMVDDQVEPVAYEEMEETSALGDDESMDSIAHSIKEINLEDEKIAMDIMEHFSDEENLTVSDDTCYIKHFSRKHPLLFIEEPENLGEQVLCSGCEEPLLGPNYSCSQCSFLLHKTCAMQPCVTEPQAYQHQFIHWMRSISLAMPVAMRKQIKLLSFVPCAKSRSIKVAFHYHTPLK